MKISLYELLECEPDATPDAVKQVYKTQAKKWHPDKPGGSAERFRDIEHAYRVLSDPEKRAYYDKHGDVAPDAPTVNPLEELYGMIERALGMACQNVADLETTDILAFIRKQMKSELRTLKVQLEDAEKNITRLESVRDRITRKDGENVVAKIFQHRIDNLKNNNAMAEKQIRTAESAIELLAEYDYRVDPQSRSQRPQYVNLNPSSFFGATGQGSW